MKLIYIPFLYCPFPSLISQISNAVYLNTLADCPDRLATALKLASHQTIVQTFPGQMTVVESHLREMGVWEEYYFEPNNYFACSVEKGLQVNYTVLDHIILRPLTTEHVKVVNEHLPYKSDTTPGYLRQKIEYMSSIGAFERDTGELMAWIMSYMNECHSALHVKPEYRRTGLGKLLAKKMTKDRALQNRVSHCYIRSGNVASENLFLALGFEWKGLVWFGERNGVGI